MNIDIEFFCEKLILTFYMVKYGIFLYPIVYLLNVSFSSYYLEDLKLFIIELPIMLVCIFLYITYRRILFGDEMNVDELLD